MPLPEKAEATKVAQSLVNRAAPTKVSPLLIDASGFTAGQRITVAAGGFGAASHNVLFVLNGPGGRTQRLVTADHGVAVGLVTLPSHLQHGRWTLGVEDLSQLQIHAGQAPAGTVSLALAVFTA
ncbi:hypothetical protein WN71_032775 [Streptomyces mangrovisoli]|uniref:Uncharacterized protein n=1 Tax=Streptomyces mangrovisoli TaxID=1428628 RepID=A0A1J4NMG2_9ACTN|nr:hypothetical protein WN71_032775 [Streptomyces mangrovisoli]